MDDASNQAYLREMAGQEQFSVAAIWRHAAAIRAQSGNVDPDRTMQLLRNYRNANSPRGPISIDPETRDIVQNIYIREVRRAGNQLANVELEVIPNVKDPWKEQNRKK